MPTITKEKALEDTRDCFLWLAANPGKTKLDYLKTLGAKAPNHLNACACCEFARIDGTTLWETQMDCTKCPLQSLWGNTKAACENAGSPYHSWRYKSRYMDSSSAAQIANAASEELRKLREGQLGKGSDTCNTVEPKDPYAELKQAQKDGKQLQWLSFGAWRDHNPDFTDKVENYRIKPTPKYRPWKAAEVPVGALIRWTYKPEEKYLITCSTPTYNCLYVGFPTNNKVEFTLAKDACEHSLDHGLTWLPCGILVEE